MRVVVGRKFPFCLLAVVVLLMSSLRLPAWNNVGHRAVAELVWREMNSVQRKIVSKMLHAHPHYKSILTDKTPAEVDRDEWAFLTAAVWPDLVRKPRAGQPRKPESVTKFDLYPHAIGYPIVWPENNGAVSIEHFSVGHPNAEQVLSNCLTTARGHRATPEARAVALCWVLHLTADLHQPLHAATIVSPQKPRGDGLGGDYYVITLNGRKCHLHAFWDELGGIDPSYRSVARLADEISTTAAVRRNLMPEYSNHRSIPEWVHESYNIAKEFAYDRAQVKYAHLDDLDSGKVKE
jgi:hypothetical protein